MAESGQHPPPPPLVELAKQKWTTYSRLSNGAPLPYPGPPPPPPSRKAGDAHDGMVLFVHLKFPTAARWWLGMHGPHLTARSERQLIDINLVIMKFPASFSCSLSLARVGCVPILMSIRFLAAEAYSQTKVM